MLKLATFPDLSQTPCRPRPHFCEHSGSSAIIRTLCLQMSHFGSYKSIAFFQIIVVRSNSANRIRTLHMRLIFTRAFVACLASEWQSRQRLMFLLSSRPLSRTALRFCKGTGLFCTSLRKSRNQYHQSVRLPPAFPIDGDGKTTFPLEPCSEADHSNQGARRGGSTFFCRIPGGSPHHSAFYDI